MYEKFTFDDLTLFHGSEGSNISKALSRHHFQYQQLQTKDVNEYLQNHCCKPHQCQTTLSTDIAGPHLNRKSF